MVAMRILLLLTAIALLGTACGTTLAPQVARGIDTEKMSSQGAMADASRAYRVAFYADPGLQPEVIDVSVGLGGTKVLASQWTTELARQLNRVIAKVGLYDERFQEFGVEIFNHDIEQGDIVYKWRPPAGGPKFGRTRVATLRLTELKTGTGGDGITADAVLEVSMHTWVHLYACEVVAQEDWMAKTMACLGEKVLGDPSLYKALEAAP